MLRVVKCQFASAEPDVVKTIEYQRPRETVLIAQDVGNENVRYAGSARTGASRGKAVARNVRFDAGSAPPPGYANGKAV
jgi:hypothetical protein